MLKGKKALVAVALLFTVYLGAYLWLSRCGYADAARNNVSGFYYFPTRDSAAWRCGNYGWVLLFWPLNHVDCAVGLGRHPASAPLTGLSK
jgi:hypothetical protein